MNFDYFYGPEDAEQYQFFRIPKRLITGDEFQDISTDSKLLYGLMLDRLQLSIRSKWMDDLNRVYIIYTVEEIMEDMHCGNQKAVKMLSELEKKIGLIKRKRQGLGKPSLIYVMKFSTPSPQKSPESHFKKCENHTEIILILIRLIIIRLILSIYPGNRRSCPQSGRLRGWIRCEGMRWRSADCMRII